MINVRINNRCHPLSITTQHTHGRARANKAKGRVHISICVTYQCVAHRRADARPRANANIPKSVRGLPLRGGGRRGGGAGGGGAGALRHHAGFTRGGGTQLPRSCLFSKCKALLTAGINAQAEVMEAFARIKHHHAWHQVRAVRSTQRTAASDCCQAGEPHRCAASATSARKTPAPARLPVAHRATQRDAWMR